MSIQKLLEERLETQHHFIIHLITTATDETLSTRPYPDKWNMLEQLAHLARYQEIFLIRTNLILQNNKPNIPRYSADTDPGFSSFTSKNKDELLQHLIEKRVLIKEQFKNLSSSDLQRKGIHPVYGGLTLWEWHEFFVLHEGHHIYALFRLSKRDKD